MTYQVNFSACAIMCCYVIGQYNISLVHLAHILLSVHWFVDIFVSLCCQGPYLTFDAMYIISHMLTCLQCISSSEYLDPGCFIQHVPVSKQYNLIPAKGWW